ncbi:MAG TPA: hypothetical protein V6C81_06395 [Planktothrix sp.]|jgi:hypothetical protein
MNAIFAQSIQSLLKQIMSCFVEAPVKERVDSARMSHTRLKALARPDYLHSPEGDKKSEHLADRLLAPPRPTASYARLQAFVAAKHEAEEQTS